MTHRLEELTRHLQSLELRPGATWVDVRSKYRFLAKVWHPDRFAVDDPARLEAETRFKAISEAHAWLGLHRAALETAVGEGEPSMAETDGKNPDAANHPAGSDFTVHRSRRRSGWRWRWPGLSFGTLWPLSLSVAFAVIVFLGLRQVDTGPLPWDRGWKARSGTAVVVGGTPPGPTTATTPAPMAPPDLSRLTEEERHAAEHACTATRLAFGIDSYHACLVQQVERLAHNPGKPDLSSLTARQRVAVEVECRGTKLTFGPAAYYDCLRYATLALRMTGEDR